jgi:hypothetical protein
MNKNKTKTLSFYNGNAVVTKKDNNVESIGLKKHSLSQQSIVEEDDCFLTDEEIKAMWNLAPKHIQNYFAS